ncbi:MAG: hypothetical protein JNK04_00860 [Myxococcales bacterium]|nr:hypothetical protein [Myxococcales bacterium]
MVREVLVAVSLAVVAGSPSSAFAEDEPESGEGGMRSPAMFATGVVMGTAGGAGLIAGAYLFTQGSGSCDGVSRDSMPTDAQVDNCMTGVGQQIGGVVALITGGALFLGGIPVLAVGASPRDGAETPASALVRVAPGGASLTVSF